MKALRSRIRPESRVGRRRCFACSTQPQSPKGWFERHERVLSVLATLLSVLLAFASLLFAINLGRDSIEESKNSRKYEVKKLQSERYGQWRRRAPGNLDTQTWENLSREDKHAAADYWDRLVLDTWIETKMSDDEAVRDLWDQHFVRFHFHDALRKSFFRNALNFLICDPYETFDGHRKPFLRDLKAVARDIPFDEDGVLIHWPGSECSCPAPCGGSTFRRPCPLP